MSTVKVDTLVASDGTSPVTLTGQYAAKAWVNFNGTGTVAIRESEGVSSISDNGTGDYTVNFTTAITDANYSYEFGGAGTNYFSNTFSASSIRMVSYNLTGAAPSDATANCVAIHR